MNRQIDQIVKGYQLQDQIGSGGFGVVYRAHQAAVNRDVAIKVILPQYANQPDFIRRFETEAQLVARLEHPHIVPLYDYWRDPDGAYLVMRYLRGGSLKERIRRGLPPLDEVLHWLDQVTEALAFAHQQRVVHRDLKPGNILLDEGDHAYLADFGIAKIITGQTGSGEQALTGSLEYAAPEQIKGERVTPQTDIYALGLVVYELLTGEHAFAHATPSELVYKHLETPLPDVHQRRNDLPSELNAVLQQATSKDCRARYDGTPAFVAALYTALETMPVTLGTPALVEPLTAREVEVLRLLAEGCSDREIAGRLYLELNTVKWYNQQLYDKFGIRDRRQVVELARRAGILETTPAHRVAERLAVRVGPNPYKGLQPFLQADAGDFFGREQLTERLLARLSEDSGANRFLAVVGPSGSGKSSAVRAGLIPALHQGRLPGAENWFIAEMLPGSRPFDELEVALRRVAVNHVPDLSEQLRRDPHGLTRAVRLILPEGCQLLLVIDQFEELFTLVDHAEITRRFLDLLSASLTDPRSPARVVITLRADFYDRPLLHPAFSDLVRQHTEAVTPLTHSELDQAVVQPARRAGVSVEPGLLAAITTDVSEQAGALPLLQYALTELYARQENRTMTLAAYQASGGVPGALAQRAETLFQGLTPDRREIARQVFLRLVTLGEGTEDVRRRVQRAELTALSQEDARVSAVIDDFGGYRLLTFDHDPATRQPTVEVAHEALLRAWGRLRTWLDESRNDIRLQRMLAGAEQEWRQAGGDPDYLLRGSRLEMFEGWVETTTLVLTQEERRFLDASIQETRRRRSRRRRVRNAVMGIAVLIAVVMAGLAQVAFDRERQAQNARAKAEREAAVNHSLVLAGAAQEQFTSSNVDLALALALEAVRIDSPPPEARLALSTVALGPGTRAVLRQSGSAVKTVAFSPDSRWALSGGCAELSDDVCSTGELILWDLGSTAELRHLEGHTGWVNHVAFNPVPGAGPLTALSASGDGTLILWNIATGEIVRRFEGHAGGVNMVVFDPTGQRAVSGSADGTLILWEVETGKIIRRFEGHTGPVNCVAISPDGSIIASGSDDMTIILWSVETGEIIRPLTGTGSKVQIVTFRTDVQGHLTLFSAAYDTAVREWDIDTGEQLRSKPIPSFSTALEITPDKLTYVSCESGGCELYGLEQLALLNPLYWATSDLTSSGALSPDGRLFLIGYRSGALVLVNMPVSTEIRRFEAKGGLLTVDVSPDGRYLLTGSFSGGTATLWDLQTGQQVRRLDGLEDIVLFAGFSLDGKQALIGSGDGWNGTPAGRLVLWDVDTGQIVHELKGFEFYPRSYAFSADGRTALVGTLQWGAAWKHQYGGELILYDLETGVDIRHYEPVEAVMDIAFSSDGRFALTGNDINGMSFWNVETGQLVRSFDDPGYAVIRMPGEDRFLVGSMDSSIMLDPQTEVVIRRFVGPEAISLTLDLSPDGSYLISGNSGGTGTIAVWNVHTGALLRRFGGYSSGAILWNLVFSPDGQTAFSSAMDPNGAVIEWQIADQPLDELLAWVHENRYIRDFTCEERAQYRIEPLCDTQ